MHTLVMIFMSSTILAICILFSAQLLPHKLNALKIAAWALSVSLLVPLRVRLEADSVIFFLTSMIALVYVFAIPLFIFEGKIWKRYTVYTSFWVAGTLSESITASIIYTRFGTVNVIELEITSLLLFSGFIIVMSVLISSVLLLLWKMIAARKFQPYYVLLLILPIGQLMTIYSFWFEVAGILFIVGFVIGMAVNIVLVIYVVSLEKKNALEEELRETRHAMELEQSYYHEVEKRREALTKIRHDFNNHLAAIGQLINTGEEASAQNMITALSKEIIETKENPYCNIPVVNAILTEKAETCAAAGIDLAVELSLPPALAIEQLHLCSIFGNLLDNAINACKKTNAAPTIQLTSGADGDYLFIKSVNPATGPPKKTAPGRGHGSRIVSDIATRYGGDYCAEYENGIYTVVVSLLAVGNGAGGANR